MIYTKEFQLTGTKSWFKATSLAKCVIARKNSIWQRNKFYYSYRLLLKDPTDKVVTDGDGNACHTNWYETNQAALKTSGDGGMRRRGGGISHRAALAR